MKCLNCGECCKYMTIRFFVNEYKDTDVQDFKHYLFYHGCKVKVEDGLITILVPNICENLKLDNTNKFRCLVHSDKPEICKKFWCEESKIERVTDLGINVADDISTGEGVG